MIRQTIGRKRILCATPEDISRLETLLAHGFSQSNLYFAAFTTEVLFNSPRLSQKTIATGLSLDTANNALVYEVFRYDPHDEQPINRDVYVIDLKPDGLSPIIKMPARKIEGHRADCLPAQYTCLSEYRYPKASSNAL